MSDSVDADEIANASAPPVDAPDPKSLGRGMDHVIGGEEGDVADEGSSVKRLGLIAAGLAAAIVVMLFTYARTGSEPANDTTLARAPAATPEQVTHRPVTRSIAMETSPLPQPRPTTAQPAPEPEQAPRVVVMEPMLIEAVEPTAATLPVSPVNLSPTPRPRPLASVAPPTAPDRPSVIETLATVVVPPAPTRQPEPKATPAPVSLPQTGTLIDTLAIDTVAALRRADTGLPTAAESAVLGFVRSLRRDSRSQTDIADMLQRAHDAQTLPVPDKFLLSDGRVDIGAIFNVLDSQR